MKLFRTLLLLLIGASLVLPLFAEEKQAAQNSYGAVTVESVDGSGLIKLNGTSVLATVHVMGSLISQDAQIGKADIMGEANLRNTTVQKESTFIGSLQAVKSEFQKNITLLTQKAVFTASKLEGITVQRDSGCRAKQVIELKQGTLVNGSIVFEGGKGEVLVYPGSQVLGTVTGGKIIKK